MSEFKSYTDMDGNKVKIGDWVEIISIIDQKVTGSGKVKMITNERFSGVTLDLKGQSGSYRAKNTRRLSK